MKLKVLNEKYSLKKVKNDNFNDSIFNFLAKFSDFKHNSSEKYDI